VTSETERARLEELAIPPAWTDVWICADSKGRVQATGRDAEGRKGLAVLVRLLDLTGIRIGNRDSSRDNGSYGLTTLRRKHVDFTDGGARVTFRGKGGKAQAVGLNDERLTGILQACYEIPGHELFRYA
jgi:DNA topoisomerase I